MRARVFVALSLVLASWMPLVARSAGASAVLGCCACNDGECTDNSDQAACDMVTCSDNGGQDHFMVGGTCGVECHPKTNTPTRTSTETPTPTNTPTLTPTETPTPTDTP